MVAASCLLDNTSTLLAPLPSHVSQVLLHRFLLEILFTIANVRVSSAEGAGAGPAGLAEANVRELVHFVWGNIAPTLCVATEEFVGCGVVQPAALYKARDFWEKLLSNVGGVDIHLPNAASGGSSFAVFAGVAY